MNKYIQEQTAKTDAPFTFRSRIIQCKEKTVDKIYVVLALFILLAVLQTPIQRSYYRKNHLLYMPSFPETLPLKDQNS